MNARHLQKPFYVLVPLLLAGCAPEPLEPNAWQDHVGGVDFFTVGYDEGLKKAAESDKPALFYITTRDCGHCKRMGKTTFTEAKVKTQLRKFTCVLVDAEVEPQAASKLGAYAFPHFVVATNDGEILAHISGYKKADDFAAILEHGQKLVERESSQ